MHEYGKIIKVTGDGNAVISIQRSSACDKCGACEMGCHQDEMQLTVANIYDGQVGDYVELELSSSQVLKASAIVYLIPLGALILGVIAGFAAARFLGINPELLGATVGLLFTAATFFLIRSLEPIFKRGNKYSPQMVNIIRNNMKGDNE